MTPTYANLEQFTADSVIALVDDGVSESKTLDYKQTYAPGHRRGSDFCKDISALANTQGGVIIIGVDEVDGVANNITGIGEEGPDDLLLALTRAAASNIRPNILIKSKVLLIGEQTVVILATPQSHQSPHMVHGGVDRFFKRLERSVEPMNADDVRYSVMYSRTSEEHAISRHAEGVQHIQNPDADYFGVCISFHTPEGLGEIYDPADSKLRTLISNASPTLWGSANARVSFHGIDMHDTQISEFHRLYRDGTYFIASKEPCQIDNDCRLLPASDVITMIHKWVDAARNIYTLLGYRGAIVSCASFSGLSGKQLGVTQTTKFRFNGYAFQDPSITMPVVTFDTKSENWIPEVELWHHRLWNAGGYDRCFDERFVEG